MSGQPDDGCSDLDFEVRGDGLYVAAWPARIVVSRELLAALSPRFVRVGADGSLAVRAVSGRALYWPEGQADADGRRRYRLLARDGGRAA